MPPASRKIVFHMPSLVADDGGPRRDRRAVAGDLEPSATPSRVGPVIEADPSAEDRDVRKLATLLARELESTVARAVLVADTPTPQSAEGSGAVVSQSLAEAVGVSESNLIQ